MTLKTEDWNIVLEDVFSGVLLRSPSGEELGICMRDSGFEINYGGKWHIAKEGLLREEIGGKGEQGTGREVE